MLSTKHSFAWSGQMPCTGVYACIHCGHVEKDAHPLDYSSVNRDALCPALVSSVKVPLHEDDPLHLWFELSYAQYLTIPRSVLQSMPQKWKAEFARLLLQLDETIDWRPKSGFHYCVELHTVMEDTECRHGVETRVDDPFANYERGRRRIPHRTDMKPCTHECLDMDGCCRSCGADCRGVC